MGMVFYGVVKAIVYIGWCYLGVRWFRFGELSPIRTAIAFGMGRLVLGVIVGLFIFLAALSMNNATRNAPLTYFSIYVPVRILEWFIWYCLLNRIAWNRRVIIWIIGGIFISCLADIPLGIINNGVVPVGRPFC